MLLCNCAAPLISSGNPLCIGGAGFVTAVMVTLAVNARTREAKRLRENVPEVGRLAVRIVTDNLTQLFVPEETRDGLTIERRVPFSYPDRSPRYILNAEWGLSLHAQSFAGGEERNVLVDFGFTPEVLNNNMAIIGIDPSTLDAAVLSHGITTILGVWLGSLRSTVAFLRGKSRFTSAGRMPFEYAASGKRNLEHSTARLFWILA
jgi:7,8-dihydropterin-6-yl-methyl-4-(beta-D-ribofuranosyl)aminobenzene 5'-phosphate synthase